VKAAAAETVDAYLDDVPQPARESLEKLRQHIRSASPAAAEGISYRIPTFKYLGSPLVGFAAFKDHCSFFVMSTEALDAVRADVARYSTAKGTVHFPPGKPLPAELVRKIVKARMLEVEQRKQR